MCLIDLLEKFQTLVVGFIGFAGVIITLLVNAWTARRQRRYEIDHERGTLRVALIEELSIIRDSMQKNAKNLREGDRLAGGDSLMPTDPMEDAYHAFLPRIGLLTKDEVGRVMKAYLSLRTFNGKLFIIGVPVATNQRHMQVPAASLEILAGMQENIVPLLSAAIDELEQARDAA